MFTGITQEVGTIQDWKEQNQVRTFTISAPKITPILNIGDSVSIDGACMTVIKKNNDEFEVEAIQETLEKTICGSYNKGTKINLEPAMQMTDRFHGHMVSGHVDFVGEITEIQTEGDSVLLTVTYPQPMGKYFSLKGSVTINGVSLTVSKIENNTFEVSLIPHTLTHTTLEKLKKSDKINIEIDLIARYLERLLNAKEDESNYFFLKERGFI